MVVSKLHVISGLPRSGSTLLGAILRQNPKFCAAMTSPITVLCDALQKTMCEEEFSVFFDDTRRKHMLRGIFDLYYPEAQGGAVVFNTDRTWTGRAALLGELYPQAKIICCVREVGWVIDSIERMLTKNPLQLSRIFDLQPGTSVYARTERLMNLDFGFIGQPWANLRACWFGENAHRIIIVQYDKLANEPERMMRALYKELDEPYYEHDFNNAAYDEPEFDAKLGMPGMHKVRAKVAAEKRSFSIPPEIHGKYADANFWMKPEYNVKNVKIL